jgi:hypothetical protein
MHVCTLFALETRIKYEKQGGKAQNTLETF